ncbi:MAG TPA: cytochrome c oxidase subunit 3, partial [Stellaceae bacterium]|nr:cytochrome c oxidase subunit 3 [Stellaceae bacterium]
MTDTHIESGAHADAHGHGAPKHPYHLVDPSPWPLVGAGAAGLIAVGGILYMHGGGLPVFLLGVIAVLLVMAVWWRDVIREATFQGYHTPVVQLGLR